MQNWIFIIIIIIVPSVTVPRFSGDHMGHNKRLLLHYLDASYTLFLWVANQNQTWKKNQYARFPEDRTDGSLFVYA